MECELCHGKECIFVVDCAVQCQSCDFHQKGHYKKCPNCHGTGMATNMYQMVYGRSLDNSLLTTETLLHLERSFDSDRTAVDYFFNWLAEQNGALSFGPGLYYRMIEIFLLDQFGGRRRICRG